jgi:hypothetical protein
VSFSPFNTVYLDIVQRGSLGILCFRIQGRDLFWVVLKCGAFEAEETWVEGLLEVTVELRHRREF